MKKIIAVLASSVVLAGVVLALPGSASAGNRSWWCKHHNEDPKPTTSTTNEDNDKLFVKVSNNAYVSSKTVAVSNTGFNKQSWNDDNSTQKSGDSAATAVSTNVVNSTVIVVSQN